MPHTRACAACGKLLGLGVAVLLERNNKVNVQRTRTLVASQLVHTEVGVGVDVEDVDELRYVLAMVVDVLDIVDDVAMNRMVLARGEEVNVNLVVDVEVVKVHLSSASANDVVGVKLETLVDVDVVELVVLNVEVEDDMLVPGDVQRLPMLMSPS
eukprot:5615394-Amphidinium_carterae.1